MPADTEPKLVFVSMTGPDRVGLISAVTGSLFDLGANLADTNFAVLGTGFDFNAVCEIPGEIGLDEMRGALAALPDLDGAEVSVEPFSFALNQADNARITHMIEVVGGDRPGLIARLTEAFMDYGANIVRMNSVRAPAPGGGTDYVTRFEVSIPPARADQCLAAISNSAQQLSCSCSWEAV